tara:strand:- start:329 stop:490 length:162 start_codon:yes stop_codon:yes gene_type:complete
MEEVNFHTLFSTYWPVFVAIVGAVVLFAKAFNRLDVLEEKVRTLFQLFNDRNK